jgi:fibro-slime domain-containing protein
MQVWAIRSIPGIALSSFVALTALGCGSNDDSGGAAGTAGASGGTGGTAGSGGTTMLDAGIGGSAATEAGVGGSGGSDPLTACGSNLTGIIRDFRSDHPDFECTKSGYTDPHGKDCGPWDPQIVGPIGSPIGPNRKPSFAQPNKTPSTNGPSEFDQWFNDVAGVNMSQDLRLDLLSTQSGSFVYDTNRFFPIDGKLFDADPNNPDRGKHIDDDGVARNYHFTYELHTTFKYEPGSVFTFRGDDDVFVYIDDKLVVNLGGIHVALQGKVDLDAKRLEVTAPEGSPNLDLDASLGFTESIQGGVAASLPLDLVVGQEYTLDFFFAERNCCGSNFRMETNLVFIDCGAGTPK